MRVTIVRIRKINRSETDNDVLAGSMLIDGMYKAFRKREVKNVYNFLNTSADVRCYNQLKNKFIYFLVAFFLSFS